MILGDALCVLTRVLIAKPRPCGTAVLSLPFRGKWFLLEALSGNTKNVHTAAVPRSRIV